MHKPILAVENLSVYLRQNVDSLQTVVENISFQLMQGETLAIVGESGSGKTMLALSLMQLLPENARVSAQSKVLYREIDLLSQPLRKIIPLRGKKMAMVFQEAMVALNPVFTVYHQIEEVLQQHVPLEKSARRQRIYSLLQEVGISDAERVANSYIHQLSGGLRQRVMIAIALAGDPEILIADEPTTAIDVTIAQQILKLLKELQKKRHLTLIFISHDLAVVAQIANNILVLKQGKMIESASLQEFIQSPKNQYSKELIAAVSLEVLQKPEISIKTPLLDVRNLKVSYPIRKGFFQGVKDYVHAVNDVSFQCYPGQTLAIIGESGSGKTSISNAILQLVDHWSGEIRFDSYNMSTVSSRRLRKLRKDLQIILQDPFAAMDPRMLVGDILLEGLQAQHIGQSAQEREILIDQMLLRVGLSPTMKDRYPHEFSGGQRQRICIARALVMQPRLLICDEPTSALDVLVQKQILQLLRELQQEFDLAYLLITHHLHVVSQLADEVIVLYQGKIVEQGTVTQILNSPQHPYTQKLIQAMPKLAI